MSDELPEQGNPDRPEGMVTEENMVPHDEDSVPGTQDDDEVDLSDDEDDEEEDDEEEDDDSAG